MGPFIELQIPRNSKSVIGWLGKVVSVPNAVVRLLKDVGAPDGLRLGNRSRNGVAGKLQKPKPPIPKVWHGLEPSVGHTILWYGAMCLINWEIIHMPFSFMTRLRPQIQDIFLH
jgi:hypothetical protein